MVGRVLLLSTLFLLAGCLDEAATDDLGTEGADGDPAPEGDAASVADEPAEPVAATVPHDEALDWDGSIGTWAIACGPGSCYGTGVGTTDNTIELTGLVSLDVTATWTTPNELAVGLANDCDGSCEFVAWNSGGPGVSLSATDLDPERTYTLVLWHPFNGANGLGAQAGPETAFHVEGTTRVV